MLQTEWGEHLNPEQVLSEYPRPQMVRSQFTCLNGFWDYAVTSSDDYPERWDGRILVPFSPEAPLSTVNRCIGPSDRLWYRCVLSELPREGQRLLLHFGAVDQMATVFLNGHEIGSHIGGFAPFTLDLSSHLSEGGNILTVRVRDLSDTCELSAATKNKAGRHLVHPSERDMADSLD